MSSALSSIRTRRTQPPPSNSANPAISGNNNGYIQTNPNYAGNQVAPNTNQGPPNAGTATLQQIIEIYGKRINALESRIQQNPSSSSVTLPQVHDLIQSKINNLDPSKEIIKEWDNRFELIAQELADLKDIVLHLQDYTMTINKVLFEKLPVIPSSSETFNSNETLLSSSEVRDAEPTNELSFTSHSSSTYHLEPSFTTNKQPDSNNDFYFTTKLGEI